MKISKEKFGSLLREAVQRLAFAFAYLCGIADFSPSQAKELLQKLGVDWQ